MAAGADLDYMNDRKVFTGLAKMTALQRAEDIGAKKIRDFLKSKGAAAVSLRFGSRRRRRRFTHRRQEGDEGEAAERRLSSKYPLSAHKVLRKRGEFNQMGPTRAGGCLLYTSPSPRDVEESRMPSSA